LPGSPKSRLSRGSALDLCQLARGLGLGGAGFAKLMPNIAQLFGRDQRRLAVYQAVFAVEDLDLAPCRYQVSRSATYLRSQPIDGCQP
jgi:hypothetical protein